jgi:hypothetical protein
VRVDSTRLQEYVQDVSCMPDDSDPRPQFRTKIVMKNKLKVDCSCMPAIS